MKRKFTILVGDKALWVIYFLLSGISLVAVYSTIGLSAIVDFGSTPMHAFLRHLLVVLVSWVAAIAVSHLRLRIIPKPSRLMLYLMWVLLLVILIVSQGRWIAVPGFGQFQPSELAKVLLMICLARDIAANKDDLSSPGMVLKILLPVIITCILVGIPNLSTALLIFTTAWVTLYFGGYSHAQWWKYTLLTLAVLAGGFLFLYFIDDAISVGRVTTWSHRLQAWVHPNPDLLTQENMARMAVARGGFWGSGIGTTIHGRLMTQAHCDFIYAIIIEESGTLAATLIFALYAWFYFRCIRIATACKKTFGSICVAAMGTLIMFQALIHMTVSVGLIPVTGQTLPFVSYGGSAYLFLSIGLGVIQAVARANAKAKMKAAKVETDQDQVEDNQDTENK